MALIILIRFGVVEYSSKYFLPFLWDYINLPCAYIHRKELLLIPLPVFDLLCCLRPMYRASNVPLLRMNIQYSIYILSISSGCLKT